MSVATTHIRDMSHSRSVVTGETTMQKTFTILGATLVAASSKETDGQLKYGGNKKAAATVGQRIAEKAKAKGITKVAFDRGPFKFHGRIQVLADAARKGGLEF